MLFKTVFYTNSGTIAHELVILQNQLTTGERGGCSILHTFSFSGHRMNIKTSPTTVKTYAFLHSLQYVNSIFTALQRSTSVFPRLALIDNSCTYCPLEVWTRRVMRVEVAGQTQFRASMAYLHSSSQTTWSKILKRALQLFLQHNTVFGAHHHGIPMHWKLSYNQESKIVCKWVNREVCNALADLLEHLISDSRMHLSPISRIR